MNSYTQNKRAFTKTWYRTTMHTNELHKIVVCDYKKLHIGTYILQYHISKDFDFKDLITEHFSSQVQNYEPYKEMQESHERVLCPS